MFARSRRGQVFIIVLIVILAIIALFIILPMIEARRESSPVVQQVSWRVNNQNATTAYLGEEVEVHVHIKATDKYQGSIVVKIKKDIAYWFDSDYVIKTFPVDLKADQVTELKLTFSPDEASQGTMRGYLVEIDFLVSHTNWVMDDSYPPRLEVLELGQGTNVQA
jgi:hypothetical protein